ncbi:MerR family transcriptional regulator [Catenuloplanes indicus]|uniref:DNA-binding transcriptional MerR regulator n=1 Tax=Catenuloplanes indicus TaxID=137267 RepID=A0AAE3W608_9ACTN|nr:MerR family transcriptional regulator [Catenuloplanes indicus]MDQ0370558.1 DNA-binding transcriptional MerR regulator [Catenuloplanes indicus]
MDLVTYTPAEAAEKTGLTLDTLRYYERSGLLNDVERTSGGRRVYTDAHLGWLDVLVCLRRGGMPIRQVQRFVDSTRPGVRLRILEEHRRNVLREMEEQRRALGVIDGKIDAYRRLEKEEHPNE